MRYLILDYIQRHPLSLGYAIIMSLLWGAAMRDSVEPSQMIMIMQIAIFGNYGILLDLPKGYLRITGMLPLRQQQIVRTLWFFGVVLVPCLASLAYWIGVLGVGVMVVFVGKPWVPAPKSFFLFVEMVVGLSTVLWSMYAVSGDPTKTANWARGLWGWCISLIWIGPLFISKAWWVVLYESSPYTVLPFILVMGALSYVVSPLILTSGPQISWPGGAAKPKRVSVALPIEFLPRWMVLLRALANPLLKSSLMMGVGMTVWFGIMVHCGPEKVFGSENQGGQFMDFFGVMMMTMMVLFIFGIGVGSIGMLRGLRVLPVSTQLMAGLMTLLPLEAWAGFGSMLILLSLVVGQWVSFPGMLPLMFLYAGASCLLLALVFRCEHLVLLYFGGFVTAILLIVLTNQGILNLKTWAICLPLALVSISLAYVLNLNSLRRQSTIYRPRVLFMQLAPQAMKWHMAGKR